MARSTLRGLQAEASALFAERGRQLREIQDLEAGGIQPEPIQIHLAVVKTVLVDTILLGEFTTRILEAILVGIGMFTGGTGS